MLSRTVGLQNCSVARELIEDCVDALEDDFRNGNRKSLQTYLPDCDNALRHLILIELIKVDLELQWKAGQRISLADYCERYDELDNTEQLPPDLVFEAYRVACQHGNAGSAEQFCQSYPKQRDAVLALVRRSMEHSTAVGRQKPGATFQVGDKFGDLELLMLLGEGAFGRVYLAQQVSLARQVALKISANRGTEARTMASLEHDNIVKVFFESVDPKKNIRLLAMQYVPGTNLGNVIRHLVEQGREQVSGPSIIDAVDHLTSAPALFKAGALKERTALEACDAVQAACWIGSRLAGALAHAHQQGTLHRDIKPDNILISQFARPLLADFNLSLDPHEVAGTTAGMFGGSLAYMSPEHLDAFNPVDPTPTTAVDERSDIYSLGIVLYELATLRQPFQNSPSNLNQIEALQELASERRAGAAAVPQSAGLSEGLILVLERCMYPDPDARFQTGTELAEALESAQELHSISKALPPPNRIVRWAQEHLLLALILAALIPNLLGSMVNISYNVLRIVPNLTIEQRQIFDTMLLGYNVVIYPICVIWLWCLALPIVRHPRQANRTDSELTFVRRRVVAFPLCVVAMSCLGWLPGGILFPLVLHTVSGPVPVAIFGHFAIDFTISGLIALTYSYFGVEIILLRTLYPKLLLGVANPREVARQELQSVRPRIRLAQLGAGVIPLAGAVMLLAVGQEHATSYDVFRVLVIMLIVVGMVGFCLSVSAAAMLQRVLAAISD